MALEKSRLLPDVTASVSPTARQRAALTVCMQATDVEDARQLLDMLGLLEESSAGMGSGDSWD